MADSFGLKIGVEGEKEFKKALSDINRSFRVLGSEMNLVASEFDKQDKSVQALTARNTVLNKEIDAQKQKISTLETALENAADSFGENDRRTQAWQTQLNNAKASLNKLEREVDQNNKTIEESNKAFDEAGEEAEDFGEAIEDSGKQAEDAGGKFEKLGGVAKGIGIGLATAIAAIGTAVVAAGASLITLGDDYNKAINQISASTGATGKELESLGETAKNVYSRNFGDSLEEVADGISVVSRITGLMDLELQKATESGFALRDTFGYDLQESARTVNALMQNFGLSAEEAYNIIAVGAQKGADQNGDLLDTLNEYSAQYSAIGLSADQFVAGLIKGGEAGVFSIDKVGDAVKEFNIRAKDGSSGTMEAFSALGMNANKMMSRFAKGGDTAQKAFFEVVNALDSMEDPIAKNTAAVALFGTMYEDLETNVLPVLASMEDGAGEVYDALSQINEVKYNDLETAVEGTKRSIEGVFLPMVSEVSSGITDVFSTLSNEINAANGDFNKISEAIGTAVGGIATIITEQLPVFINLGMDIITSIGGAILENLPIIIDAAINIIMTLLEGLISSLPLITEGALQLLLTLIDGIIENLPALVETAIQMVVTLATGIAEALPELVPAVVQAIITVTQTIIENLPLILDAALQIILGLAQGLLNALPQLIAALPTIIKGIINFIINSIPQIIKAGVELLVSLVKNLPSIIVEIVKAIPEIIVALVDGFKSYFGKMGEVGGNLIKGLWKGISDAGAWLRDKISGFFGGVVDSIKNFFGIKSPSTLFAELGGYMGEGLGVGFEGAMKEVEKDMQDAIPTDFDFDTNLGVYQSSGDITRDTKSLIEHTGVIEVRGVNDKQELTGVVEIILDQFRREARIW